MNDITKHFLKDQLIWMAIYFSVAITITIFVDFPYSLILIIAIVIPISLYRRRRLMKKLGLRGNPFFGAMGTGMFSSKEKMRYYCISCGTKHGHAECPNCGSKMKKAVFD